MEAKHQPRTLDTRTHNRNLDVIAWGLFFVWWGLTDSDFGLLTFLPHGIGALGIGVLLLGLNAVRALNGIATGSWTITLGVLALVLGVLELAGSLLNLPFQMPILAIVVIALGLIFLGRQAFRS